MLDTEQLIIGARAIFEAAQPEKIISQHELGFSAEVRAVYDDDDNVRHYEHLIEYELPRALPFSACFSKEGLIEKVTKLFRSEMQVGDPIFDDVVWIKSDGEEEACRAFLTDRCQGAVLNFVQQQGWVSIEGESLEIFFTSPNSGLDSNDTLEHHVLGAYAAQWLKMS